MCAGTPTSSCAPPTRSTARSPRSSTPPSCLLQAPPATAVPPRVSPPAVPAPGQGARAARHHERRLGGAPVAARGALSSSTRCGARSHAWRRPSATRTARRCQRHPRHLDPCGRRGRPKVSVIMALYNHAGYVGAALDSVAACHVDGGYEMVIVDDGSTDASWRRCGAWLEAHPWVAGRLVGASRRPGLPHARNTALDLARGEHVFILDADNEVYRARSPRSPSALDRDPEAWFAYGMLESFGTEWPGGAGRHVPVAAMATGEQQLHRRDGDGADRSAAPTRRSTPPTLGSTGGRTTTCGAASPKPVVSVGWCPTSWPATAPPPRRWSPVERVARGRLHGAARARARSDGGCAR